MSKEHLIMYVKPTEDCNLNCLHCYNKTGELNKKLDLEKFDLFLQTVGEYYAKSKNDVYIEVVFHGGEPLLHGVYSLNFIKKLVTKNLSFANIAFSLQSNLTLLDDAAIDFIVDDLDNIVGTSYSPMLRFMGDDKAQYEIWEDNVQKLIENDVRVYSVITLSKPYIQACTPDDLINFLLEKNFMGFHFEPLTNNGNASANWDKIVCNPEEYDAWKAEFTRKFIERGLYKNIESNEIVRKAKSFYDGVYVGCSCRNCMLRTITFNSDGTIGICPNVSKTQIITTLNNTFEDFINSELRKNLIITERQRREECLSCAFFQYCNGGCMQTNACYEGKEFFGVLQSKLENDKKFREYVQKYERTSVFN